MRKRIFILAALAGVTLCTSLYAEPITTGTLVNEMVDMRKFADFPDPFYKTIQFSSYDHRSALPGGKEWFYNADGFGREPVPNFEAVVKQPDENGIGEYLVCDVEGPGAIVRFWTARIGGAIRTYLDGAQEPVFDGPAQEFFMQPYKRYAEAAGIDPELLAGTFYQRNAAYCPFPFAKRCRVVWMGRLRDTHFYQLQVRLYEPGAEVVTFDPDDLDTYRKAIRRVAKIMTNPEEAWDYASKEKPVPFEVTVEPGARADALVLDGPKAIERLSISVEAADRDLALRQTVLHIVFDDFPWGQVQAPVGDLFGAAPGVNPYSSVPFTVTPDGDMTCRYVMPFAQKAEIVFENLGDQPVTVRGEALPMDHAWSDDTSMHFRARWRIDHGLTGSGARPQDMPYLIANGAGVYVGSATYVLNPNDVPSSGGNWWGEGDEKVFVDDDVRPSTFGTGSEDYYNYAWSSPDIFIYPYCAQPRNDGPANRGFVTNHRWHILDPLPFRYRLSFYMELYPHETNENMAYGRIGYHYARPGLMDGHVAITREDVRRQELPSNWIPASRSGARNSVFYQAEDRVQGAPNSTFVEDNLWSGGRCYRWQPEQPGEELAFTVPIAEEGRYIIRFAFALDPDSGRVSAQVDGKPCGFGGKEGTVDLDRPSRTLLRCSGTAPIKLTDGEHTVTLRHAGGPQSIGVDFLWVQHQK